MATSWTCPYCGRSQILGSANTQHESSQILVGENEFGDFGYSSYAIACLNPKCRRVTLRFGIYRKAKNRLEWDLGAPIQIWGLLPKSSAKPQPEFIPAALRDDYVEACRIRDLSPKASATLRVAACKG